MTDRTARYMARVATHLPSLPSNAARRSFLLDELYKWDERYSHFRALVDSGNAPEPSPNQPTAFDFVETMQALEILLARYAVKEAA